MKIRYRIISLLLILMSFISIFPNSLITTVSADGQGGGSAVGGGNGANTGLGTGTFENPMTGIRVSVWKPDGTLVSNVVDILNNYFHAYGTGVYFCLNPRLEPLNCHYDANKVGWQPFWDSNITAVNLMGEAKKQPK